MGERSARGAAKRGEAWRPRAATGALASLGALLAGCLSTPVADGGAAYRKPERTTTTETWLPHQSKEARWQVRLAGPGGRAFTNHAWALYDRRQVVAWREQEGSEARVLAETRAEVHDQRASADHAGVVASERVHRGAAEERHTGQGAALSIEEQRRREQLALGSASEQRTGQQRSERVTGAAAGSERVTGAAAATERVTAAATGSDRVTGQEGSGTLVAAGAGVERQGAQESRQVVRAADSEARTELGGARAEVTTTGAREEVVATTAGEQKTTEQARAEAVTETSRREEVVRQTARLPLFEERAQYQSFIRQHQEYLRSRSESLAVYLRRDRLLSAFFKLDRQSFTDLLERGAQKGGQPELIEVRKWAVRADAPEPYDDPKATLTTIEPGRTFRFVLEVRNTGQTPAQALVLCDLFPRGLRFDSRSERGAIFDAAGRRTESISRESQRFVAFATPNKLEEGQLGWNIERGLAAGERLVLSFEATYYLERRVAREAGVALLAAPDGAPRGTLGEQDLLLVAASDPGSGWLEVSVRRAGSGERVDGFVRAADTRILRERDAIDDERELQRTESILYGSYGGDR